MALREEDDIVEASHVFFKVLSPKPCLMKGISYGSGVVEGFRTDEMAVCLLHAARNEDQDICVSELDGDRGGGDLRQHAIFAMPWLEDWKVLRQCLYQWTVGGKELFFRGSGADAALSSSKCVALLQDMIKARAFAPDPKAPPPSVYSCPLGDSERQACLQQFFEAGLVARVQEGWIMTPAGIKRLGVRTKLQLPCPCLQADDRPLGELPTFFTSGQDATGGMGCDCFRSCVSCRQAPCLCPRRQ